jgi:hypothetical protein
MPKSTAPTPAKIVAETNLVSRPEVVAGAGSAIASRLSIAELRA